MDRFEQEGKGKLAAIAQNYAELANSLKICSLAMPGLDVPILLAWTNCVTGWDMDEAEFLRAGERSFNLKRLLNLACGHDWSRRHPALPFAHEPFKAGSSAGFVPDLPKMLSEYYEFRGWGQDGVPTESKLKELGLATCTP